MGDLVKLGILGLAARKLLDGAAKAAAPADARRPKPEAARSAAQFPAGDRQAQSLAEALRWTETSAQANGVTAATGSDLRLRRWFSPSGEHRIGLSVLGVAYAWLRKVPA